MADIELVIKIPDFIYTEIRNITNTGIIEHNAKTLYNAIYHGTPLPEHHGRLIDADAIIAEAIEKMKYLSNYEYMECVIAHMNLAPTIIEGSDAE